MSHLGICQCRLQESWTCIILSRQRDEILYQVGTLYSLVGVGFFWVGAGSFEKVSGSRRRWEHTCSHQISIMLLEPKNSQKNPTFIGTFSATKKIWFDFLWWRNLGPLPTEQCLQQQGQNHRLRIFKEIGKLRSSPPTVISKSKKSISSNFSCSLYFQIASPLNLPDTVEKKEKCAVLLGRGRAPSFASPLGLAWKVGPFCGIPWQSGMNFALCEISSKKHTPPKP